MKKKYSFALFEILISLTLIALVLGFFSKGIFHSTKKSITDIQSISNYHTIKNYMVDFEMNVLPTLTFEEIVPYREAKWQTLPDNPKIKYTVCHYLTHQKKLKDLTQYKLVCLRFKMNGDKKEYKQVFIVKNSSRKT